jgi:hypothetical protein
MWRQVCIPGHHYNMKGIHMMDGLEYDKDEFMENIE